MQGANVMKASLIYAAFSLSTERYSYFHVCARMCCMYVKWKVEFSMTVAVW